MSVASFFQDIKKFDPNNPDFENMGSWPAIVKFITCILLFSAVLAAGYWFFVKDSYKRFEREVRKEETLKNDFKRKAFQVANLEAFKIQLSEMQDTFGTLLEQLPNETEISGLLDDITFTGIQSGLEFNAVNLTPEMEKEFYIETPMKLQVVGEYHEMGTFISGISALPRIVTLHDFSIKRSGSKNANGKAALNMTISAKTYKYNPKGGQ